MTAARRELVVISVRRRVPPSDRGRVGRFHDLHAIGGLVHAVRGRNVDTARVARAVGAVPNVRLRVAHRVRERVVKAARHAESAAEANTFKAAATFCGDAISEEAVCKASCAACRHSSTSPVRLLACEVVSDAEPFIATRAPATRRHDRALRPTSLAAARSQRSGESSPARRSARRAAAVRRGGERDRSRARATSPTRGRPCTARGRRQCRRRRTGRFLDAGHGRTVRWTS